MLALIETKLFQFITFFFVHLRASVDGITNVCGDISLAQLNPNHRRMLVPTWMAWRAIQLLERSGYDKALPDIRFAFGLHAHNAICGSGLRGKVCSDDDILICMQANSPAMHAPPSGVLVLNARSVSSRTCATAGHGNLESFLFVQERIGYGYLHA